GTPSTDKVIGIAPVSAVGMIVTCHMPQRDPSSRVTETTVAAVVEDRNSVAVMTCCGVSALPLLMPSVAECGVTPSPSRIIQTGVPRGAGLLQVFGDPSKLNALGSGPPL